MEVEGSIYFISDGHKIAKNKRIYLNANYVEGMTYPDGRAIPVGYHEFDAEGKLIIPPVKHGIVGDFLYINDVKQTCYKLMEFEGSIYFISDGHKIVKNKRIYLSANYVEGMTYPDGRAIPVGYHEFDAEGKLIRK
jgi:hypothetical protein